MTVILKCLLLLCAGFVTDLRVYFFTAQQCPPCHQMAPIVDRLAREGYPIQKIDVNSQSQLAKQFKIQSTPTTVIVSGNRIVGQQAGIIGYAPLKQRLDQLVATERQSSLVQPASLAGQVPSTKAANAGFSDVTSQQGGGGTGALAGGNGIERLAIRATVRLRVVDSVGTSFATGTVIHTHGGDALILTCGHVFRDSQGKGQIKVDVGFGGGQVKTVPGQLMDYNAEAYDIALVAFKPGIDITPIPIARKSLQMNPRANVFSIGCDSGRDPTIRRSNFKKVTRYDGVDKFDVVGRPVNGRSGGGLFSSTGQLIGVCNAASVNIDEGIYTAITSVYWQLERANLAHLFENPGVPHTRPDQNVQPTDIAATGRIPDLPGRTLDPRDPIQLNNPSRTRAADQPGRLQTVSNERTLPSSRELIMVLRDKNDPTKTETVTIANPTRELLQAIKIAQLDQHKHSQRGASNGMVSAPRAIPDLPPQDLRHPENLRAQSPK